MLDVLTDAKWSPHLSTGYWLIEHPEGLIMVDTRESSRANDKGYQVWWHPFMQFCERRGVKPRITQFAHDFDSEKRLNGQIFTVPRGE